MFYDIDILNRRGGKFGIIWLAANKKLRLKGKGSKNDLRLLLEVRVDRICQDIIKYVRTENPGTEGPSPRFSLYLSAMLTHGAIIAHHKQVTHTLATVRLTFQQKAAEKKLKEANISCDVLDLSDAVIGAGKNLLNDGWSLEDSEYGRLVNVVDALSISSFCFSPNQTQQAPPCEVQLNHPASPGQIEKLFSEMEVASGFPEIHLNNSGIYALPNNITMKEAEPIVQDLETINDDFFLSNDDFEKAFGPPPLKELNDEELQSPGASNLRRSNSKRVNDDDSYAAEVPSKQSRTDPTGEEALTTTTAMQYPVMVLEPLLALPIVPRKGGRRRQPRLIIDEEIIISAEQFRAQLDNYEDLLRIPDEEIVRIEFKECTVRHIFLRPSVERYQNPLIRKLITRNFVTVEDGTEHNDVPNESNNPEAVPMIIEEPPIHSFLSTNAVTLNNSLQNVTVEVQAAEAPVQGRNIVETVLGIGKTPEKPLNPQPFETSIVGSANASNVNVSNASLYGSPYRQAERHFLNNMQPINEASESNASSQHLTGKKNAVDVPPIQAVHGSFGASFPVNNSQPSPSKSQRKDSFPQVQVPEPQALLDMIEETTDLVSRLTFRQLVPPTKYSKLEAAKIFETLLGLAKDRRINMSQDNDKPFSDIFITLDR